MMATASSSARRPRAAGRPARRPARIARPAVRAPCRRGPQLGAHRFKAARESTHAAREGLHRRRHRALGLEPRGCARRRRPDTQRRLPFSAGHGDLDQRRVRGLDRGARRQLIGRRAPDRLPCDARIRAAGAGTRLHRPAGGLGQRGLGQTPGLGVWPSWATPARATRRRDRGGRGRDDALAFRVGALSGRQVADARRRLGEHVVRWPESSPRRRRPGSAPSPPAPRRACRGPGRDHRAARTTSPPATACAPACRALVVPSCGSSRRSKPPPPISAPSRP